MLDQFDPNSQFYRSTSDIDIYEAIACTRLATQMAKGRYLRVLMDHQIQLWEDGYSGFVADFSHLQPCSPPPALPFVSAAQIHAEIEKAIAYIQSAMSVKNQYLWGGTVPPNYDCSGLIQAAFNAIGVWVPRDAYQQEGFATPVSEVELAIGDLIFFGSKEKATHVAMYLGDRQYIHSSGQEKGNNGIGINSLSGTDLVSQTYARELRGFGRINKSLYYQPIDKQY